MAERGPFEMPKEDMGWRLRRTKLRRLLRRLRAERQWNLRVVGDEPVTESIWIDYSLERWALPLAASHESWQRFSEDGHGWRQETCTRVHFLCFEWGRNQYRPVGRKVGRS
jgi:hypothetical protein